jgi:hypothetical protein
MKAEMRVPKEQEPAGIVISRGSREEPRTLFSAYIWGPAPEAGADDGAPKAA